jgi:hypothetical protein
MLLNTSLHLHACKEATFYIQFKKSIEEYNKIIYGESKTHHCRAVYLIELT